MSVAVCLSRKSALVAIVLVIAFNLNWTKPVLGQVTGATLTGTVKDPSGGIIPNAQVSIKDMATGVTTTVSSSSVGLYAAPNLLPSTYEVKVTAAGFRTFLEPNVTLTVGAQQQLDITMEVGPTTQTLEVTTEAPTVQLTSSTISGEVNSTTVRELPLNGRSWTDLATLQPGVSQVSTMEVFNDGGAGRGNRGFGQEVAISGSRPTQNNYRLDGVSINDYANGAGSILGGNLGVDAIQEFSVLTSNYSAEYGKTSGGVVNAITRSGTNQFHGSVYEFLRNSALDARNFFDGPKIPPFRRNQFGASGGAPIQKDKTFIFADYEGIRQALGLTQIDLVPSTNARLGILSGGTPITTPCPAGSTNLAPGQATTCVDNSAARFLSLYPLPNPALGFANTPDIGEYANALNQETSENFFTVHLDRKFSDKDSAFATYLFDRTPYTAPDAFSNVLLTNLSFRQSVILQESHTFSSNFVNSVRFGFNRVRVDNTVPLSAINAQTCDAAFAAVPGQCAPEIKIGGGLTLMPGGPGATPLYKYRWNTFQGYDDAFLTRGRHTIKFGASYERDQDNQLTAGGGAGIFSFPSLEAFYANQPSNFQTNLPGFLTERGLRESIFGAYIQDDWHVRPSLTVNLGLRYEMATVPIEVQGKLSTLINLTDATPHLGSPFFLNPTERNFEPRVGFSWDPFHDGKTAVRGGFGVFDVLPLLYEFLTLNGQAAPFYESASTSNLGALAGAFPTGALALVEGHPTSLRAIDVQNQPKRDYVMQWNLNVQHQITPSLTATLGYIGSHGVHQPFRVDDADSVLPTLTSAGYLWPAPIDSGTRLNTNFGSIRYVNWGGESLYDALIFGVQKNMSHGLQVQGSFTWGRSIDTDSSVVAGNAFQNSISSMAWYNLSLDRGPSDFNIPRTLVISGIWEVPHPASTERVVGFLTNGWELGAIFKASDGPPFTPTWGSGGDPLGTENSDVTYSYPDRLSGSGCSTLVNPGNPNNYIKDQCFALPTAPNMTFWQANCDTTSKIYGSPKTAEPAPICFNLRGNAGRNTLEGPGLTDLDFSVYKNNYVRRISETFNVQFRAELFNILNHPNFEAPLTPADIFTSNGTPTGAAGKLTATTTTSRQIQFALKVLW